MRKLHSDLDLLVSYPEIHLQESHALRGSMPILPNYQLICILLSLKTNVTTETPPSTTIPSKAIGLERVSHNWGSKRVLEQVTKVEEGRVICCAQNDANLDGLLTVIHSERSEDGMSSSQVNIENSDSLYRW